MKKILFIFLAISNVSFSQITEIGEDLGFLVNDALFFSKKYLSPSEDPFIYQSSSGWMSSVKKKPIWSVTAGINFNTFFVPKKNREISITNSDFSFFSIENENSSSVPTAIGNDNQIYLVGQLGTEQVRIKTPEGINQELVFYPHLSGGITLWYGTEFLVKLAPKTKLKKSDYQVYGVGIKHNLDQYFRSLQNKKINLAGMICFSKEIISFEFLDAQTSFGNLGLDKLTGDVAIWQAQFSASKEYKNFEFMLGVILTTSDIEYRFAGPKGALDETISFRSILNERLKEIYKTRNNYCSEIACRYKFDHLFLQTSLNLGKYVNTNVSIQYEFN